MLYWGHCVAGVRRLNPIIPATRLAPPRPRSTVRSISRPSAAATQSGGHEQEEVMDKSKTTTTTTTTTVTVDQGQEKLQHHGNIMEHSFGEGYATRSDEEGFGGIYGANQSLSDPSDDPDYDKTQGSEVTGKERARNQQQASC